MLLERIQVLLSLESRRERGRGSAGSTGVERINIHLHSLARQDHSDLSEYVIRMSERE